MENSAKALSFPNWARLKRDKGNYPTWRKHVIDHLQASGCEQAIRSDYSQLAYNSVSDSDSSDEDFEDDFSSFTLGGKQRKHDQTSPTTSQEQLEGKYKQEISAYLQGTKKARQKKHKERKRRKKTKKFEEKKRQMAARARTLIRSTIDAKAFAPSTFDCETAYDLWTATCRRIHRRRSAQGARYAAN
jgi:superfamily II DNA helicase RecQ